MTKTKTIKTGKAIFNSDKLKSSITFSNGYIMYLTKKEEDFFFCCPHYAHDFYEHFLLLNKKISDYKTKDSVHDAIEEMCSYLFNSYKNF
jgi:hypothetical protein